MNLTEFKKVGDMLSREHHITITEGDCWAADIKERVVKYVKNDIYTLPEDDILGLLLHETAHIHYTTDIQHPADNKELFHTAMNMVEDISIENIIAGDYPNAKEILTSSKTGVLDNLLGILPKLKCPVHEKALLYGAIRFEGRGYAYGMANYEATGNVIAALMERNRNLILNREKTADLIPLVNEIVKILIDKFGAPTEEEKSEMKTQGEPGRPNSRDGSRSMAIDSAKAGNGWTGKSLMSDTRYLDEIVEQATMLGKKLRTILKRNNSMEFGGRFRTGKLLARRFVRIKVNKDKRPFARRTIKSNQSYSFAIMADVSGSMNNGTRPEYSPLNYAMNSMLMVGNALRYAGISRSLGIFGYDPVVVGNMGTKQVSWEDIADQHNHREADNGGTDIAKAIDSCVNELNISNALRKVMIVLTDGATDPYSVEQAYRRAKKEGIECMGIALGNHVSNDFIKLFGKDCYHIKDMHDSKKIVEAFTTILKTSVTLSK